MSVGDVLISGLMQYLYRKTVRSDPLFEPESVFFAEKSIYAKKLLAKILILRKKGYFLWNFSL